MPHEAKARETRKAPGKENPSERSYRSRSPGDDPVTQEKGEHTKTPGFKKTSEEREDSSLHLDAPGKAVTRPTVSVPLEQGSPTVSLEIQGKLKRFIIDTGSNYTSTWCVEA
jgi:hypothetical protein